VLLRTKRHFDLLPLCQLPTSQPVRMLNALLSLPVVVAVATVAGQNFRSSEFGRDLIFPFTTGDACNRNKKPLRSMVMKHKTRSNYLGNVMRRAAAALCIVASVLCTTVFASGQDKQTSNKNRQTLTVSSDGK